MTSALENYINRILQRLPRAAGISQGLGEAHVCTGVDRCWKGQGSGSAGGWGTGLGARGGDTGVRDLGPTRLAPGTGSGPKASFNLRKKPSKTDMIIPNFSVSL